jgi:O-acetylhomoserine/O-acetylserine sulfhydrylase
VGFEKRIAALEDGVDAVSFSCGASAVLAVIMSLARAGDNVVVSAFTHGGTFHQFKVVLPQLGIESRLCDTNDLDKVEQLIDDKTKLIFTESIGNPKLSVADMEPLAAVANRFRFPLVVDATFTAGGYFCQPAKWGADIIVHSATKWIGGHGTTLGGVAIETGRSDWQSNGSRFPQLHGRRPGREGVEADLYEAAGNRAYMRFLRLDVLRDTGACLGTNAAQQLFIGAENLSLRCERQSKNADRLAHWLREHPRVVWVRYLGFESHPYHQLAQKYLQRGFGTVLTFGPKGGSVEGLKLIDAFKLILNTPNVGDSKTLIGHHWSTTHKQCTEEENEAMGVTEDLFRVSLGIENIDDIIGDFERAFEQVPVV